MADSISSMAWESWSGCRCHFATDFLVFMFAARPAPIMLTWPFKVQNPVADHVRTDARCCHRGTRSGPIYRELMFHDVIY